MTEFQTGDSMKANAILALTIVCLFASGCSDPIDKINSAFGVQSGTADSGGGNGTGNKVYESYIVNPEKLNAYKLHLQPMMDRIDHVYETAGEGNEGPLYWKNFLRFKTWYIAPVELKTISKDVLGMSFSNNSSQQIALQTAKEIWINLGSFSAMNSSDQSDLILHEFIMNLYFSKFKTFKEMCLLSAKTTFSECDKFKPLDELLPAKPTRTLNSEDYQNIRRATGFFKLHGLTATRQEMDSALAQNEFDERFFRDYSIPEHEPEQKIELKGLALQELLDSVKSVNKAPDKCFFLNAGGSVPCKTESSQFMDIDSKSGYPSKFTNIAVTDSSDQKILDINSRNDGTIYVSRGFDLNRNPLYVGLIQPQFLSNPKIGDLFRSNTLIGNNFPGSNEMRLNGFISIAGKIIDVKTFGNRTTCVVDWIASPATPQEDTVIVIYDQTSLDYLKFMAKQLANVLPAPCY